MVKLKGDFSRCVECGAVVITAREQQIFNMLSLGYTCKEMAEAMGISERGIDSHCDHLRAKFGVADRYKLVVLAVERRMRDA